MLENIFLFVGLIALAATFQTLRTADDQIAIICGLIGAVTWLLWAYSSLNIIHYDGSGNPLTVSYPALAAFGVMLAIPNLYIALTGPLRIARNTNEVTEDLQ